jgi:hypothetical protein
MRIVRTTLQLTVVTAVVMFGFPRAFSTCYEAVTGQRCAPPDEDPTPPPTGNNCCQTSYSPADSSSYREYDFERDYDCGDTQYTVTSVGIVKKLRYFRVYADPLLERNFCTEEVIYSSTWPTGQTCSIATRGGEVCGWCD